MKVIVTGVDGFVGPYLVDELTKRGHEVSGTYKDKPKKELGIKMYRMDLLDDKNIREVMKDFSPDVLIHLAGISSPHYSIRHPEETIKVNFEGTKKILDNTDCKVLIISTSEVYGIPKSVPISEEHPLMPNNPYAESKLMIEGYASRLIKDGREIIITRPFNHIGPGQTENFVTSSFAKQIARIELGIQEPVIKVGNLDAKRDFTDVRDVVKAYSLLIEKGESGKIYNISSGNAYRIGDILDTMLSMSKINITVENDPERMRPSDIPTNQGDSSRMNRLGWKPEISIKDSIEDILEEWRKNERSNSTSNI